VVEVGGVPEVAGGSIPLLHPYPVPYDGAVSPSAYLSRRGKLSGKA